MKSSAKLLNKYVKFKPEFSDPGDDTINKKVIEDNGNRVLIRFEVPGSAFQPTQTVLKSMIEKVVSKKNTYTKNPASKNKMSKELDHIAIDDLYLTITSDSDLYRQQHQPILKNLATKKARGIYDHEKAIKLFMYLVENGAKKYVKDFGGTWNLIFPKPERLEVAKQLTKDFETEYEYGNYNNLLPKKYIKNPARKKTAAKKQRSPEKQYKDFHHKNGHKTITDTIDIPDKFIHIGKAVSLIYESDKFDGKPRLYKHDFKKHGNILAKPEGKTGFSDLILMNNLKFKIKKEGITG